MMAITCAQNIDRTRIIALYDNVLPAGEVTLLREHAESCPSCGAYLDDIGDTMRLLSSHRLPASMERQDRQDQVWLSLRHQIMQRKKRSLIVSLAQNTGIRSLGAVAAAVALVVLFVQVLHVFGTQQPSIFSPPPIHFASSVAFTPFYVSADGATILGASDAQTASATSSATITDFNVPAEKAMTLYSAPANQLLDGEPASDGSYLAWAQGTPAGGGDTASDTVFSSLSLNVMNLQTKQTQTIASKSDPNGITPNEYGFQLAHASLFWQDNDTHSLLMRDLAIGATGPARTLTSSFTGSPYVFQVSWPYIIYPHIDGHEHLLNVTTGKDTALPDPPTPFNSGQTNLMSYQFVGTTVIASWLLNDTYNKSTFQYVSYDVAGTTPLWSERTTINFHDINLNFFAVNDRLFLFDGLTLSGGKGVTLLYDRQSRQLTTIAPKTYADIGNVANAYLLGKWLVLTTGTSPAGGMSGALFDTTQFRKPPPPTPTPQPSTPQPTRTVLPATGTVPPGGYGTMIQCVSNEQLSQHIHANIQIYFNGKNEPIPAGVGIETDNSGSPVDFCWLHTHQPDGVVHIESPHTGDKFMVGDFLAMWDRPEFQGRWLPEGPPVITSTSFFGQPLDATHQLTVYVQGKIFTGDPKTLILQSGENIWLEYGTPLANPTPFDFVGNGLSP